MKMIKTLILAAILLFPVTAYARDITREVATVVTQRSILNSGDYFWQGANNAGPVRVSVNLSTQMAYVYSGDSLIGVTNVSSGRDGFNTPVGVFTVLGKEDNHHSKHYNADMPFTMWLTNDGVALHSGGTPGRPSSHGCVHLPKEFAALLYSVVQRGTVVEITNDAPLTNLNLNLSSN